MFRIIKLRILHAAVLTLNIDYFIINKALRWIQTATLSVRYYQRRLVHADFITSSLLGFV